jgi:hypothetical protein
MFNNVGQQTRLLLPLLLLVLLLLLGAAVLVANAVALAVALTVALTVGLTVRLAATTSHYGGLGARKYLRCVHWFYSGQLFFYGRYRIK